MSSGNQYDDPVRAQKRDTINTLGVMVRRRKYTALTFK